MLELDKDNDFIKSVFAYFDGGNINDAVKLFRQLEIKHEILFTFIEDFSNGELSDEIWIENKLFPFLSDSQLIVAGNVIDDIQIYNVDFQSLSVTWRHCGKLVKRKRNRITFNRKK